MTYRLFSSMSGYQAGIRQTAHPEYTICRQLLPDSTDGLGYLPWNLRVHICSLLRLHRRVLSWLWHIRSIVLLHIPMHPRRCLHNYTASPYKHSCSFYTIDGVKIGIETGMGPTRINTILQSAFFKLTGIIPEDQAIELMKAAAQIRSDTGILFRLRSFAENISSACGTDFFS